jgi:hypothetical protein
MAKDLDTIVAGFVADVSAAPSGSIQAVVLYGSAAGGSYLPGRSDLNFLLVSPRVVPDLLHFLQNRMKVWAKQRIASPLIVDASFLSRSLDSYPLEILGMQAAYKVLYGTDPLVGLAPEIEHVRVQVEREAKSKILLLRRGFIESAGHHKRLAGVLAVTLPAVDAMLRGMLYVKGVEWRLSGVPLRAKAARVLELDLPLLEQLREARHGSGLNPETARTTYDRALLLVASVAEWADSPLG